MGQLMPFKTRDRTKKTFLTAEQCAERAAERFAEAYRMQPGTSRQSVLKEACDYRILAEMKRALAPQRGSGELKTRI